MKVLIQGSPDLHGRCRALADYLIGRLVPEGAPADDPSCDVCLLSIPELEISGCNGCDGCMMGDHVCVLRDDMDAVRSALDTADELIVISPVYWASVPSQLKACMDRLQPYWWQYRDGGGPAKRRTLTLHIVREGGDPYGCSPLIGTVRSAFSVLGYRLAHVYDWIGCITKAGKVIRAGVEIPTRAGCPASGIPT